jgi:hypothetical protein
MSASKKTTDKKKKLRQADAHSIKKPFERGFLDAVRLRLLKAKKRELDALRMLLFERGCEGERIEILLKLREEALRKRRVK